MMSDADFNLEIITELFLLDLDSYFGSADQITKLVTPLTVSVSRRLLSTTSFMIDSPEQSKRKKSVSIKICSNQVIFID